MGIQVVMGSCYLVGFVGGAWDGNTMVLDEGRGVGGVGQKFGRVARKHPQSAYAGLQKSLQQEWAFMQQVTPGIGDEFAPLPLSSSCQLCRYYCLWVLYPVCVVRLVKSVWV